MGAAYGFVQCLRVGTSRPQGSTANSLIQGSALDGGAIESQVGYGIVFLFRVFG
jgi:hypothetical protein